MHALELLGQLEAHGRPSVRENYRLV
jgi:hypothetical protein